MHGEGREKKERNREQSSVLIMAIYTFGAHNLDQFSSSFMLEHISSSVQYRLQAENNELTTFSLEDTFQTKCASFEYKKPNIIKFFFCVLRRGHCLLIEKERLKTVF